MTSEEKLEAMADCGAHGHALWPDEIDACADGAEALKLLRELSDDAEWQGLCSYTPKGYCVEHTQFRDPCPFARAKELVARAYPEVDHGD